MEIMKNLQLISIIVPVYNSACYLSRCIDSILAQTYSNLEIILVDDGSKDVSPRICDEYARKDRRIIVIHKNNQGLSSARNMGLDYAHGDYIGFVDSDDWIEPDMFEKLYLGLQQTGMSMIRCGITRDSEYGILDERTICEYNVMKLEDAAKSVFVNGFSCNKLFRSELFNSDFAIRFNPEIKFIEDEPVVLKCLVRAGGMAITNYIGYHYYINEDSLTGTEFSLYKVSSLIGFKEMCDTSETYLPDLLDYFESKYYTIAISFMLNKKTRHSTRHKMYIKTLLSSGRKRIVKLKNMQLKFKIVGIFFSYL